MKVLKDIFESKTNISFDKLKFQFFTDDSNCSCGSCGSCGGKSYG